MNKKLFFLYLTLVLTFAVSAAVFAEPVAQWNGYYCTSGGCGVNAYNYSYGYYDGYFCTNSFVAPFQAEFVRDVTYPDGTYVMPGSTFTKTWRIRNIGTQAWTTDTRLVFVTGDAMGATGTKIPYYVAPGNTVDISLSMTAPSYGGTFSGQWMLLSPDGTYFGVGCNGQTPIWVAIKTWTNGACSCLGQTTCNCLAPTYRAGRNPYCNNKIRSIEDVTYPDGSVVAPGASFRKVWKMKNGGTCVWNENYQVTFFYGDDLSYNGTASIVRLGDEVRPTSGTKYQVNRPQRLYVNPNDYVYVSIDLVAPTTPGVYESYYKLRDNLGYEFGFGSYADSAFWVNIVVSDEAAKTVDTSEASDETGAKDVEEAVVEPADAQASVPEVTVDGASSANKCGEQSIAMRSTETGYEVLWTAVNAGENTWENYTLVKSDSNPAVKLDSDVIKVPLTAPGETAEVSFNINLDGTAGSTDPYWVEFFMNSGTEDFCQFYFEAPAK